MVSVILKQLCVTVAARNRRDATLHTEHKSHTRRGSVDDTVVLEI